MTELIPYQDRQVRVRFEGQSWAIALALLDLGELSADDQIRAAVAAYLGVPAAKLARYVVERHANGNITVRPEAVFG